MSPVSAVVRRGTSFATSDVEVVGIRTRRVVLLHSIVGFFSNALVAAVAFQVLQGLVSGWESSLGGLTK